MGFYYRPHLLQLLTSGREMACIKEGKLVRPTMVRASAGSSGAGCLWAAQRLESDSVAVWVAAVGVSAGWGARGSQCTCGMTTARMSTIGMITIRPMMNGHT